MKKFEYRLEELHIDIKSALNPAYTELHDQLEEKLNELGKEGMASLWCQWLLILFCTGTLVLYNKDKQT